MPYTQSERRAFIVSPHQDDAVISLGAHLGRYGDVDVANIFTISDSHMLPDVPDDSGIVSAIRRGEDVAVANRYGFSFSNGGFPDSELRGVAWNDYWAQLDPKLLEDIETYLTDTLSPHLNEDTTDIFIPAAFGMHPDHVLAHFAALRVRAQLGLRAWFLYADQPYCSEPQPVRLANHRHLNHQNRIVLPFDHVAKEQMLACYPSQLPPMRVRRLVQVGSEHVWPVTDESGDATDRHAVYPGIFSTSQWREVAREARMRENATIVDLDVARSASGALPLYVDHHDVAGGPIQMLRPVGAGYYDYLDTACSEKGDTDIDIAVKQLDGSGDVLWLSGLREDGSLYALLAERSREGRGYMFEGAPSFVADCHPNGFEAWVATKKRDVRRKIRRNDHKLDRLAEERAGSIQIVGVDEKVVDEFLRLQAARAELSEGKLDAFKDDELYTQMLRDAAHRGLLKAVCLRAEDEMAGVLLFSQDDANRCISIINQGFNPKYAEFSPGFLMQQCLMRYAHASLMREVDYLKGDEPYKRDYTNRQIKAYKYIENIGGLPHDTWEEVKKYVTDYVE
jgi:CelD/BcsL family acetyltransferase involved in cellulose biosynthesis/LmbE family N-acetylglucosaminyl deacetylase